VEDWEIMNTDPLDHPVHLHTNSFQILGTDGQPERAWRDIMNVRGGMRRRFRVYFRDFEGRMVYHCHRVFHGDLGMMAVIEISRVPIPARSRAATAHQH
jgi:suppressor of ftsI